MLSVDNAAEWLIERELIDVDAILAGDLTISSAVRRNRNLRIKREAGPGYLVKQPEEESARQTLRAEAAFYAFCRDEESVAAMRDIVPRLALFEDGEAVLVLDLLHKAVPLWEHYAAHEPAQFPLPAVRAAGEVLARFHTAFRLPGPASDPRLSWLPRHTPWILRAHKPSPDVLTSITPANAEALRILQTREDLSANLDALRGRWQASTLIHNDIKSDNVLVVASPGGESGIRLVDWELVQIGDPAWDIAGMLQDFILFWINSMQLGGGQTTPEAMIPTAKYPLPVLQGAIRAFWKSYRSTAGLAPADAVALIERAVAFSAARLIQSAYEIGQSVSSLVPSSV